MQKGELNQFTACSASPLPKMKYCALHLADMEAEDVERLDTGRLTRAKRKELGILIEELTTEQGCRKREMITQRSSRSKTAGMLFAYRTCGISLGHLECIHSGSCLKNFNLLRHNPKYYGYFKTKTYSAKHILFLTAFFRNMH